MKQRYQKLCSATLKYTVSRPKLVFVLTDLFFPFLSDDVLFYGPECPYLYKGKRDLNFEERFDVLVANVDSRKICTKQPLRVQENAAFVIQRPVLKDKGDWLVTDLGSFNNFGHGGKVFQVEDGNILSSRRWPRRVQDRFDLEEDEYLVLSTYWKHAKYSDFSRITTVVSQKDGQELDLALVKYQYEGEEHHRSPKKNHERRSHSFRLLQAQDGQLKLK